MKSKNKIEFENNFFVPHFNYVLGEISNNIYWKINDNKEIVINKQFLIKKLRLKKEEYDYYKQGQLVGYSDSFIGVENIRNNNVFENKITPGKKDINIEIYDKNNEKFYITKIMSDRIRFCKSYLKNINNRTKILNICGYYTSFPQEQRNSNNLSNSISLIVTESFLRLNNLSNKLRLIKQYYMFNEKQIKKLPKKLIYFVVNGDSISKPTKPIKKTNIIFNDNNIRTQFFSKAPKLIKIKKHNFYN